MHEIAESCAFLSDFQMLAGTQRVLVYIAIFAWFRHFPVTLGRLNVDLQWRQTKPDDTWFKEA